MDIDHINHNTLDNRRSNLRTITHAENLQNQTGAHSNNKSSGIRGVYWCIHRNKWRAQIKLKGKQYNLGYFEDKYKAGLVAKEARLKMMPFSLET
jgi:hypothetical protein